MTRRSGFVCIVVAALLAMAYVGHDAAPDNPLLAYWGIFVLGACTAVIALVVPD